MKEKLAGSEYYQDKEDRSLLTLNLKIVRFRGVPMQESITESNNSWKYDPMVWTSTYKGKCDLISISSVSVLWPFLNWHQLDQRGRRE